MTEWFHRYMLKHHRQWLERNWIQKQWVRQGIGGHAEQWWLDHPALTLYWFKMDYCVDDFIARENNLYYRPALARGTPVCEDWPIPER